MQHIPFSNQHTFYKLIDRSHNKLHCVYYMNLTLSKLIMCIYLSNVFFQLWFIVSMLNECNFFLWTIKLTSGLAFWHELSNFQAILTMDWLSFAPTISLGSHQNIGLHTGARANVVLLTYLLSFNHHLIIYSVEKLILQFHRDELQSSNWKRINRTLTVTISCPYFKISTLKIEQANYPRTR